MFDAFYKLVKFISKLIFTDTDRCFKFNNLLGFYKCIFV